METVWDWITVFAFAGLVTLMLQRSSEEKPRDKLWHYGPPAVACAVANQVGNANNHLLAGVIMAGVVAYVFWVLKVRVPKL